MRKKNVQKNVQANVEGALEDAVRNLLRGTQLREAVATLMKNNPSAPAAAPGGGMAFAHGDGSGGRNFKSRFQERWQNAFIDSRADGLAGCCAGSGGQRSPGGGRS